MKKILLAISMVITSIFILTGCSNAWKKNVQISELNFIGDESYSINKVEGQIKNLTDNYYKADISASAKNGSIDDTLYTSIKVRPNELATFVLYTGYDKNYSYEIKDVKLTKLEIPKLEEPVEGELIDLSEDVAEYYFPEIYKEETLLTTYVSSDFDDTLFTFFDPAMSDNLIITNKKDSLAFLKIGESGILLDTVWDKKLNNLQSLALYISENYNIKNIDYIMYTFNPIFNFSITSFVEDKILELLKNPDNNTYECGNWLFSVCTDQVIGTNSYTALYMCNKNYLK